MEFLERAASDRILEKYGPTQMAAIRLANAASLMAPADAAYARELARGALRASGCMNAGLYRALQPPPEDGWAAAHEAKAQARSAELEQARQLQQSYNIRDQQRVRGGVRAAPPLPAEEPNPCPPTPTFPPRSSSSSRARSIRRRAATLRAPCATTQRRASIAWGRRGAR